MSYLIVACAIGIGLVAGLRSLLAPAAVAWAVHLGWLPGISLRFMGSKSVLVILSLLALAELIADKLPGVPRRTAVLPLVARIFSGGLCGACVWISANQALAIGAILGAFGALTGAFVGYEVRRRLVSRVKLPDLLVALAEDAGAISLALFSVSR